MRAIVLLLALSLTGAVTAIASCGGSVSAGAGGGSNASSSHTSSGSTHASSTSGSPGTGGQSSGDAGRDAAVGLTCADLITCEQGCKTAACPSTCYAEGTGVAQGLYDAFTQCLGEACPDGGSACDESAAMGGCIVSYETCLGDTASGPPDPDGGGVVVPDAGQRYDCRELAACIAGCPKGSGSCISQCGANATNTAVALDNALNACVAMSCASSDAGNDGDGGACSACAAQQSDCDADTSN